MPSLRPDISIIGPARIVTTSTTAQRNSAALAAGRYVAIVNAGNVRMLQGDSAVTATQTNAQRMEDNSVVYFTVPATGVAFSYMSLIAVAGTPTVSISGVDELTAASTPGAWA